MAGNSNVDTAVLAAAAQINPLIAVAAAALRAVFELRKRVADAAPQLLEDGTLAKSDKELIAQFASEAGLLKAESAELLEWLHQQAAAQPPQQ